MNIKRLLFLGITLSAICFSSITGISAQEKSQSGYIITKSNDTIRGYIQNVNINQFTKCSFKKEKNSPTIDYLPGEIAAYRFDGDGKFFISMDTPSIAGNKTLFLEYLIKGKANIYFMRDNSDHYYIQKNDDKLIELTEPQKFFTNEKGTFYSPQKYTGRLKYILSDCPQIYSEIDAIKMYPNQLIKLAKHYHERVCDSAKCIVFERKIKPVKFHIGVFAGMSYNDFRFNASNYSDKRPAGLAGCKVEIENLFFSLERVNLNIGGMLQYLSTYNFNTQGYIYNGIVYGTDHINNYDLNIRATTVRIPVTIQYLFTQTRLKPYIGGGVTNLFFLSQNKNLYVPDFNEYYGKAIPFYHLGIIGTAGLKYQLKNRCSVFLEFSYEKLQNMNINEMLRMHDRTLTLETGIMF